jgi:quinol monooxygenase YgiN
VACVAGAAAMAQDGPGKGYSQVPQGAYSVVAEVRAKPGKEEDREARGHFMFYEVFASQADFEAHNAMPYVKAWFAKLPELADGGVRVMRMEILNGPRN